MNNFAPFISVSALMKFNLAVSSLCELASASSISAGDPVIPDVPFGPMTENEYAMGIYERASQSGFSTEESMLSTLTYVLRYIDGKLAIMLDDRLTDDVSRHI